MLSQDVVRELIEAARPLIDAVDETCGTIPMIERLEEAIESAEKMLEEV